MSVQPVQVQTPRFVAATTPSASLLMSLIFHGSLLPPGTSVSKYSQSEPSHLAIA